MLRFHVGQRASNGLQWRGRGFGALGWEISAWHTLVVWWWAWGFGHATWISPSSLWLVASQLAFYKSREFSGCKSRWVNVYSPVDTIPTVPDQGSEKSVRKTSLQLKCWNRRLAGDSWKIVVLSTLFPWKRPAAEFPISYIFNRHHISTQLIRERSVVQRDLMRSSILTSIKHRVSLKDEFSMSVLYCRLAKVLCGNQQTPWLCYRSGSTDMCQVILLKHVDQIGKKVWITRRQWDEASVSF